MLEDVKDEGVLFARLAQEPGSEPSCGKLNNLTGACIVWDWLEACESSHSRMFITTYVHESLVLPRDHLQQLPVINKSETVKQHKTNLGSFYIATPESWTLVLEHRLRSALLGSWSGQELAGFIRRGNSSRGSHGAVFDHVFAGIPSDPLYRFDVDRPGKDQRLKINLQNLVNMAGVGLHDPCDRCSEYNVTGEAALLRRVGFGIDVKIYYSNLWTSWRNPLTWLLPSQNVTFELQVWPHQPVEGVRVINIVRESHFSKDIMPDYRIVRRRHGIRLNFHQTGVVGTWNLNHFIGFVVKSVTFLGVSWTLTECLIDFMPSLSSSLPGWYHFLYSMNTNKKD